MNTCANSLAFFAAIIYMACSNSEYWSFVESKDCLVEKELSAGYCVIQEQDSLKKNSKDSTITQKMDCLSLDDSEYPYAGIPRIVIETENGQNIKDRETEIPAKLQIWGESVPQSDIMELTIRGRGNTSWEMRKKSYKIEFLDKQSVLGMPKDRDWALVSNYADKTLLKNYLMYHLAAKLGVFYAPRCEFAELYLNKEYLGIYLLTETIKIAKNRINIPEDDHSYVLEITQKYRKDDPIFVSYVIKSDSVGKPFHIHNPKNVSDETLSAIKNKVEGFEKFLKQIKSNKENEIAQWIDIGECVKHYWVQELSKNPDAAGYSSIYSVWEKGNPVRMGPVWDFDLSFGGHSNESINNPENWYIKSGYWDSYIFMDSIANLARLNFYKENRDVLLGTVDMADSMRNFLQDAAKNNFKRWNILNSTVYTYHRYAYDTYDEAVDDLKNWLRKRIAWIDGQILGSNKSTINIKEIK